MTTPEDALTLVTPRLSALEEREALVVLDELLRLCREREGREGHFWGSLADAVGLMIHNRAVALHLAEVDLLRGGHEVAVSSDELAPENERWYAVCVCPEVLGPDVATADQAVEQGRAHLRTHGLPETQLEVRGEHGPR